MASGDMRAVGKRTLEWDLNDWKWDGDLFIASKLNPQVSDLLRQQVLLPGCGTSATGGSSSTSSYCSDEVNLEIGNEKRELGKHRRIIVIDDDSPNDEAGTLTLKLGGHGYPNVEREMGNWEGLSGKKTKIGGNSNRAVCQVQDCGVDLRNDKDYHRRHKVCQIHSKASTALVANVMQRFCQQCSRFHVLQEFDEGKRSCRRRLAGHNKRRRKVNPDVVPNGNSGNDDQTSGYLLLSLLKIIANLHSNKSDQTTDQDLLSQILRSIACQTDKHGARNLSKPIQEPQDCLNDVISAGNSEIVSTLLSRGLQAQYGKQNCADTLSEMPQQGLSTQDHRDGDMQTTSSPNPSILNRFQPYSEMRCGTAGETEINRFDLNDIYIDSDDGMEDLERSAPTVNLVTSSPDCPSWIQQDCHQSSPPQTSGNSDSVLQSPSSSGGDAQSRTDRIVFKLFGKEPNDFPPVLRAQILGWLSHSPTDIESYIRPGCIVLTIYIRQAETIWNELCCDLSSSLNRLLDASDSSFWRTGWLYIRVQHQIAFIHDGQIVVDRPLSLRNDNCSTIVSVKPIAVSASETAQFSVKGFNLSRHTTRLLCALEGKYLFQQATHEILENVDNSEEHDDLQCVNFTCAIVTGYSRGFIEIEDHGFSSSFFPFIVAEEDVCSEICMLESVLESTVLEKDGGQTGKLESRNHAMNFIHEMGWLLHRNQLKSRLGNADHNAEVFPFERFKWIMDFSIDHDWCAVVRKLLNLMLTENVSKGEYSSSSIALSEMGLLHRAVRRNCRPLVELLLGYETDKVSDCSEFHHKSVVNGDRKHLFRPDVVGHAGLTPLHIAAGIDGSKDVLDALTDDPGMVGLEAWKSAHDSTGLTPEDYARLRGHFTYIHLVQRKISKRQKNTQVVVDIPAGLSDCSVSPKQSDRLKTSFEIGKARVASIQSNCKLCSQKLAYKMGNRSLIYRPAMFSIVAVAAVCVCVALLFKSSPEVLYVFRPFRWESLNYGTN